MARKRRYTDEQLIEATKSSISISGVLDKIGLVKAGGNYKFIKFHIARLCLDTSHFLGQAHLRGKTHCWTPTIPLEKILIENSLYFNINCLRKRLLKEGVFERKCYKCGLQEWLGQPISLELEHKNGNNRDNRIENLTLLCPNCHAQTPTYRGRNVALKNSTKINEIHDVIQKIIPKEPILRRCRFPVKKKLCTICGSPSHRSIHQLCRKCYVIKSRKVERPPKEHLEKLVWEKPTATIAKEYRVTDNAVAKWCKQYGITKPSRGYWAKRGHFRVIKKKNADVTVTANLFGLEPKDGVLPL